MSDLRAAGATDPGRVRDSNEDRLHIDAQRGIFLVIDGVGGHAAGEIAATIARDVIVERLGHATLTPARRVREAIALANNEILRQAEAAPEHAGMTCVVTLALLEGNQLTIGHVGDTRLYALSPASSSQGSPRGICKLTHDHSPIGEREDARELSEAEAMQHPRRNEVFRDVGGAFHDPDDEDFIEVIETAFSPDQALLLCSDGLSDMLTSTAIERAVRQHAGNPPAVAQALIDAANEAGGKDNVTVVYAEGPRFASVGRGSRSSPGGRAVALTAGILAGLALGLALVVGFGLEALGLDTWGAAAGGRQLIVGGNSTEGFASIADAVAAARPRDVIRVEPGEYAEAVVLPTGVDLMARTPGTVTLVAPDNSEGWVAVTADGRDGNRISGIRVLGRAEAPIAVGFRLAGHDLIVDDVAVEGHVGTGMDVLNDGAVLVRSSRFVAVYGVAMKVGAAAQPLIRQNVFTRPAAGTNSPALEIDPGAAPRLADNTFVGYAEAAIGARELLGGNHVIK